MVCRIQELSGDDRREAGRIPRTIECELTSDLVDSCIPGDMVTITAVVKATSSEEGEEGWACTVEVLCWDWICGMLDM